MPTIAVVIPAYNEEHTITAAVDVLQRQTVQRVHIVVVDNASTDNTARVVMQHQHNPGCRHYAS